MRRPYTFTKTVEVTGYGLDGEGNEHEITDWVDVKIELTADDILVELSDEDIIDECAERGIYNEPYQPFEADKPGEDITNEELELMIAMLHELKKPSLVERNLAEKLSNIRYVWK